MSTFSSADLAQLAERGVAAEEATRQLAIFAQPPRPLRVERPCTVGDGIEVIHDSEHAGLLERAAAVRVAGRCSAFVPASGAASRMFEAVLDWVERERCDAEDLEAAARRGEASAGAVLELLRDLEAAPFRGPLDELLAARGEDRRALLAAGRARDLLSAIVAPHGLDYARAPKALLPFHTAGDGVLTAFEEHLVEAAEYATAPGGTTRVHFTISPDHAAAFAALLERVRGRVVAETGTELEVTFSSQAPATDTIALGEDGPFRQADGSLLFRPGGHGALLGNLQALAATGADVVFIKNIDNVLPASRRALVVHWRRLLLGHFARIEEDLASWRSRVRDQSGSAEAENAAADYLSQRFGLSPPSGQARREFVLDRLARPLRVCGMVRNSGEPGGGPFWAADLDGQITRQIVEASQLGGGEAARALLEAATHFNPVDLVCGVRDSEGRPHHLSRFVDPSTVFISEKSAAGRRLKALEWPGLWNGAMSGWNTAFVEVPAATFAPVKTVLDLLRPERLGS